MTELQADILNHVATESRGHSDRETLSFLYGQGYGRVVGSLQKLRLVYWYHDELWATPEGIKQGKEINVPDEE
jgi:hypothetical protein